MKLWCKGSKAFVENIQTLVKAKVWDDNLAPQAEDQVLVDLDEKKAVDSVKIAAELNCNIIVACSSSNMSKVVEAVEIGVKNILSKPVLASELAKYVELNTAPQISDLEEWRAKNAPELVGKSPALLSALEIAMQTSEFDCPILITGESGTGKELLAQAIHRASPRCNSPLVPVNCPAIPKELVESELFGHAKGAFTGATGVRIGRFAAADKGTFFLDEIGEMDLNIQSKLLRVLQDFQITPVGESKSQRVDVRVIAATNRELESMTTKGSFREDLYYRLNVVQIHLPALKERREDIPALVENFVSTISKERNLAPPILSSKIMDAFIAYHWPGNVRQLRNIIERLIILRRGQEVTLKDLPTCLTRTIVGEEDDDELDDMDLPVDGIDLRRALQRFEETMIRKALIATNGNKNQAAKILGLNRTTLVEKLRKRPMASGE